MASANCLVTNNIFFSVQQKKETHTGLEGEYMIKFSFLGELPL